MINWTKQTDDMLQAWTDTQKKLWSSWAEATEQQASQAQLAETWRKAVGHLGRGGQERPRDAEGDHRQPRRQRVGRPRHPQGPAGLGRADAGPSATAGPRPRASCGRAGSAWSARRCR